jgi:hypothetical protein
MSYGMHMFKPWHGRYLPWHVGLLSHPVEALSCHVWLLLFPGRVCYIYRDTFTMSILNMCHALSAFYLSEETFTMSGENFTISTGTFTSLVRVLPCSRKVVSCLGILSYTYILIMSFHIICICHNRHAQACQKDSLYTYNT